MKLYSNVNSHNQRTEQWRERIANMEGIEIPYAFSSLVHEVSDEKTSNKGKYNSFIGYTKGWLLGVVTGNNYAAEILPHEEGGHRSVSQVDMPENWWNYAIEAGKGGKIHKSMPEPQMDKDEFYESEKSYIYDRIMPAYRAIRESFKSRPWYHWLTNHAQYTAERDAMNAIRGVLITLTGATKAELDNDYIEYCNEIANNENFLPEVDVEEQEHIEEISEIAVNVNVNEEVKVNENVNVNENINVKESIKINEDINVKGSIKIDENADVKEEANSNEEAKEKEEVKIDENANVKEKIEIKDDSVKLNEKYWEAKQRKQNAKKEVVVVKTSVEKTQEIVNSDGFDKAFTASGERLMSKIASSLNMDRRELVQRFNDAYPYLMEQMTQDASYISQDLDACNSVSEKKRLIQEGAKAMFQNAFIQLESMDLPLKERLIVSQVLTNYMMNMATPAGFEAKEYGKLAKDSAFKSKHFLYEVIEENVPEYMIEDLNATVASAMAESYRYEEKNVPVIMESEGEKQEFIRDNDDKEFFRSAIK